MKLLALIALTSILFAADTSAPVPVKRQPPKPGAAVATAPQLPTPAQMKELDHAMQKLQKDLGAAPPAVATSVPIGWEIPVPKLPPSAHTAVEMSTAWLGGNSLPVAGRDGRVMFSYGAGLPTVVCAPLRVCVIELQAGERITAEPAIGDSVRWDISPRVVGADPRATVLVVIKPRAENLDTDLLITTDRRAYFLRLVSDHDKYIVRTAFEYPDEPSDAWLQAVKAQQSNAQAARQEADTVTPIEGDITKANFEYEVKAKAGVPAYLKPTRVYDADGKVHIVVPDAMKDREAPVLLVHRADGSSAQTNYRVVNGQYIVDELFDRAVLVIGVGKKASRIEITRTKKS